MRLDDFFRTQLPAQLFHYTDAAGFLGILEKKQIWATDVSCLNDRQEMLYARDLITEHLDGLCEHPEWYPSFAITDDENELLDECRHLFRVGPQMYDVFVASFSTKFDSLSQWREYGRYNIGVSGSALQSCAQRYTQSTLARCIYDQPTQLQLVRCLVQFLIKEYRAQRDPDRFKTDLLYSLRRYGPLLKHDSFCEEAEWRIVVTDVSRVEFREHKDIVVPYLQIDIGNALKERGIQPIVPLITLGPGNDRVREITVNRLTKQMLGFEVYVRRSDTPYVRY